MSKVKRLSGRMIVQVDPTETINSILKPHSINIFKMVRLVKNRKWVSSRTPPGRDSYLLKLEIGGVWS
jgi:hypothetical protein